MAARDSKIKANATSDSPNASVSQKPTDTSKKQQAPKFDFSIISKLMITQVVALLLQVEGMRTVYFVLKNNKVSAKQSLKKMIEINFQNTTCAPVIAKK